ncbi:MAG: hypothetical protein IPL61_01065 [Myxococcales bacterium]|nr:hypothetical protein [Myxococcales bacterium]
MGKRVLDVACVGLLALLLAACASKKATPSPVATGSDGGIDAFIITVPEDEDKDKYVPAEFKAGADRWRDTGIYVDGKFSGLLAFAELPVALKPTWIQVKVSAPKRYGTSDTGWKWGKERRYRFRDLVASMGLDPAKIKEIHVYGPRFSESVIVTGAQLASPAADEFYFRFGGIVSSKAIPVVPAALGDQRTPDKISGVMIYVDKAPPKLERNVGLVLDGEVQEGVPYFGTPLRGGVRVYKDDRLVAYIKRQDLPADLANTTSGEPRWPLAGYLSSRGVSLDGVVEAWVVRDEKWQERFDRTQLEGLWFAAGNQAKGHIELGDQKVKANALILRSTPVAPADVPGPEPEEL